MSAFTVVVGTMLIVQIALSGYASTALFIVVGLGWFSVAELALVARYYRRKERAAADEGTSPPKREP